MEFTEFLPKIFQEVNSVNIGCYTSDTNEKHSETLKHTR